MHIYTLPELAMSPPFTAEKFRTVANELQGQADDITDAIDQLTAIADAMDGATQMAAKTNVDKLMTGLDRGALAKLAADETRDATPTGPAATEINPLSAAEAFAPPPPAPPVPAEAMPPVPTTAAPPPVPTADVETDDKGNPWVAGVHADNKAKKQDGTWKARRGGAKAPVSAAASATTIDLKTFQNAMGKLIAAGADVNVITTAVSQTVFGDMGRHTGGIEHVLAADDEKLTGKAWQALKAVAIQTGNDSAV